MKATSIYRRSAWAVLTVLSTLVATGCGGGGDTPAPSARPGPEVEPAAVTSVPPAVYADNRRTLAFNRLNEIRALAGVGLLRQNTAVDEAAQSHSVYQLVNGEFGHTETLNKPSYTGTTREGLQNPVAI